MTRTYRIKATPAATIEDFRAVLLAEKMHARREWNPEQTVPGLTARDIEVWALDFGHIIAEDT